MDVEEEEEEIHHEGHHPSLEEDGGESLLTRVLNHDNCDSCGEGGDLICCDRCPASFHLECLNPPLPCVPEGDWFCRACALQDAPFERMEMTIMGRLLQHLEGRNPVAFSLPLSMMKNVERAAEWSFTVDSGSLDNGQGDVVFDEAFSDSDRNMRQGKRKRVHNDRFCYVCSLSGSVSENLAQCSKCPHSYHLWCLDPPLLGKPKVNWRCPAHTEPPRSYAPMYKKRSRRGQTHVIPKAHIRLDFPFSTSLWTPQTLQSQTLDMNAAHSRPSRQEQREWLISLQAFESELKNQISILNNENVSPDVQTVASSLSVLGGIDYEDNCTQKHVAISNGSKEEKELELKNVIKSAVTSGINPSEVILRLPFHVIQQLALQHLTDIVKAAQQNDNHLSAPAFSGPCPTPHIGLSPSPSTRLSVASPNNFSTSLPPTATRELSITSAAPATLYLLGHGDEEGPPSSVNERKPIPIQQKNVFESKEQSESSSLPSLTKQRSSPDAILSESSANASPSIAVPTVSLAKEPLQTLTHPMSTHTKEHALNVIPTRVFEIATRTDARTAPKKTQNELSARNQRVSIRRDHDAALTDQRPTKNALPETKGHTDGAEVETSNAKTVVPVNRSVVSVDRDDHVKAPAGSAAAISKPVILDLTGGTPNIRVYAEIEAICNSTSLVPRIPQFWMTGQVLTIGRLRQYAPNDAENPMNCSLDLSNFPKANLISRKHVVVTATHTGEFKVEYFARNATILNSEPLLKGRPRMVRLPFDLSFAELTVKFKSPSLAYAPSSWVQLCAEKRLAYERSTLKPRNNK